MSDIYGENHRGMQDDHETRNLADRLDEIIVATEIDNDKKQFIESRDLFFLTTIDHRGYPTCSYKGGYPGFVKVLDSKTLVFPNYDGNGMFLSLGNIKGNNKVGMLFIDFEKPHRIRVHGTASVNEDKSLLNQFQGAQILVLVTITEIFINCPRYIHIYKRIATSKYIPKCDTPISPQWKRINAVQDVLPERDRNIAETLGGVITPEEYGEMLTNGQG